MKKVLVITSVASMIDQFLLPNVRLLQDMGYEVHIACNFEKGSTCSNERILVLKKKLDELNIAYRQIDFARDITKVSDNLLAYKQVKRLIDDNKYEFIHCHSPIGGLLTRLACRKARKNGVKVFYTAHGFHFYKGAPLKNWLIYYPVEKLCARYTDVLITINQEDYALANKKMKAKRVEHVPGVGIDLNYYKTKTNNESTFSKSTAEKIIVLSVGELSKRKNHRIVLEALAKIDHKNIKYYICGKGSLEDELKTIINQLELTEHVELLGFRTDVVELYKKADLFVFPSIQEGLPVALMEAMVCKVPVICSEIRGNVDLIENKNYLFNPSDVDGLVALLSNILENKNKADIKNSMRAEIENNFKKLEYYSIQEVETKMRQIYGIHTET